MTRKKIKLAYIVNHVARRTSFKKRKGGLMQKMEEICILCDVKGFLIIFSPEELETTVWPSRAVADELIHRFMSMPELERSKKKVDHYDYLMEMLAKKNEQLAKEEKNNKELEAYHLVDLVHKEGKRIDDLTKKEAGLIIWFVHEKRTAIAKRRQAIENSAAASSSSAAPVPAPAPAPASASPPDLWVPPQSPAQEIHSPQLGFSDEYDESYVPALGSALENLVAETTLLPGSSSGMEGGLLPASGSGAETGRGVVDGHDGTTWDQAVSKLMDESPRSEDADPAELNKLAAEMGALIENPPGDESDYAFALQDGNAGGGDRTQVASGDPSGVAQGTVLHQLDFGDINNSPSPDIRTQFGSMEAGKGSSDAGDAATGEGPVENLTWGDNEPFFPPDFFFP